MLRDLSTTQTFLLSAIFPVSYVASIYLRSASRLSFSSSQGKPLRGRDDQGVIKARLLAVSLSTLLSVVIVTVLNWTCSRPPARFQASILSTWSLLGFGLPHPLITPHLLAPLLYLGPLYGLFLSRSLPLQERSSFQDYRATLSQWQGIRNYLAAPITEEIVFRSCILAVGISSGRSSRSLIFLSPLWFGVAHLHHAWEVFQRNGKDSRALTQALTTCAFQLVYTTLFGWYSCYLFIRTGSVWPSISAHIFCNTLGLPQLCWDMRVHRDRKQSTVIRQRVSLESEHLK
ncbi:Abi-domain-containing protein [Sistotremastrum suecicum HHB10207 ss-3]|uniref:intramembrane prenyl-peptidase Rce1 n=1 Tax=Sistotremastrum suecicum HHB10207 ss-3 TaxID=1314776 RepID=A0A166E789_9AGAM|nr:Abi-domain-containing protein [Sistotremastrum suecicum HHB10207 ss-3]